MAESELHKELKAKACQYLLNQSYRLARMEKDVGYWGIADAWGIRLGGSYYTKVIEVKVSMADFHSDKRKKAKLHFDGFIPAEEIYYLCPKGLITPEEVGKDVGLLWYYEDSDRLRNVKKAPFLKMHIGTKLNILIDFLEANVPWDRKMTLKQ